MHKTSYNFCFIRNPVISLRPFVAGWLTRLAGQRCVGLRLELFHVNTWILGKVRQANQLKSVVATCRGVLVSIKSEDTKDHTIKMATSTMVSAHYKQNCFQYRGAIRKTGIGGSYQGYPTPGSRPLESRLINVYL